MSTRTDIPGYTAGTWVIDSADTVVAFQVRLMGVFKTCGSFDDVAGTIVTAEDPLDSSVSVVIKTASVNTKNKTRDKDIGKGPFLNAEAHPTMTFTSTGVRIDGGRYLIDGDLTIRAVTKPGTLNVAPGACGADGRPQATFTAETEISCNDFGVTRGPSRPVISDNVKISIAIQANKRD